MPNFRVIPSLQPGDLYTPLGTRIWGDPAATLRPSRITTANDRQHRFYRCAPGSLVCLACVLDGESAVLDDTDNYFTAWTIEYAGSPPLLTHPIASTSAAPHWLLNDIGHYLLAVRRENTELFADTEHAGGVVLVHIDVTGS